jgi:hypothetical protein
MLSILNCRLLQRLFLMRLLQTTGLSVALMTACAATVHAEDVTVQGSPGVDGADGVNPGDPGQPGFSAGPTFSNASNADPLTKATAIGGTGGTGGNVGGAFDNFENTFIPNTGAVGGTGGDATATASSGSGEADAISVGGAGGAGGGSNSFAARGGDGESASSLAVAGSGTGNATASASATGGSGGSNRFGQGPDSAGGDASASSSASTSGSGDALSSANATGGGRGNGTGGDIIQRGGNAEATADASARGGGKGIANAVATQGFPSNFGQFLPAATANATSNAETVNGAMAEAVSTADGDLGEAESTAKTSLGGVSVRSTIMAPASSPFSGLGTTTDAIAEGGSAPFFSVDAQAIAFSTALTDKAYATTLIGDASNVADAFLGPQDEIFGTAEQFGNAFQGGVGTATSTFDFLDPGDLLIGVIDTFGSVDVIVNGVQILEIGGSLTDVVINLGSNFGPNIDLTINGFGDFVVGGAAPVPEGSTWAMLVLGFTGLGLVGFRRTQGDKSTAA